MHESERVSDGDEVEVGTSRVCRTGLGSLQEMIVVLEDDQHMNEFQAAGMPRFVKRAQNSFNLRRVARERSEVVMGGEVRVKLAVALMVLMMRMKVSETVRNLLEELKFYVETGETQERKRQHLE